MKGKKEGRKEGRKKGRKEKKKEMEDWYQDQNLGTRAPVIGQMSQTVDWRLNQGPGHSSAREMIQLRMKLTVGCFGTRQGPSAPFWAWLLQ
jgi:hypothetical protein